MNLVDVFLEDVNIGKWLEENITNVEMTRCTHTIHSNLINNSGNNELTFKIDLSNTYNTKQIIDYINSKQSITIGNVEYLKPVVVQTTNDFKMEWDQQSLKTKFVIYFTKAIIKLLI